MDISGVVHLELAAARAEARRAQELLAATLATLQEGIVIVDVDARVVHFNPAAEAILGLGKVDDPAEKWSEKYGVFFADGVTHVPTKELPLIRGLAGVDVRDQVLFIRNEVVTAGTFISVDARPLRDDGGVLQGAIATFRDVSRLPAEADFDTDTNGELIRRVGIGTDVDYQRRDQEALREAEERFRLVFEGAPIGMIIIRADGKIALVNAHIETLFGYRREELVGETIEMLIPASFRKHHPQYREGFLADPRSRAMGKGRDLSGLRKDGSEVAVEVGLSALKTSEGVFVLGSVVDVSERTRAETAQRHLAAVVESAEDAIITRGLDGAIRSWNPGATRLLGYRADEMVGHPPTGLIPEDRLEEESLVRGQIVAGKRVIHFETVRKKKDGSLVDVSATFTPIHDRSGGIVAVSIVMRDITERNQAERERARLVEQLKALNVDLSELNSALEQRVLDRTTDLTATLEEREILLQEVHHRVKNNLSVIASLMEMQARSLGPGQGRHALEECRGRVHAIALIHEKLYQSKNYAKIAFGDYLRGLARDIFQATGTSPSSVTLAVMVDDEVAVTVDTAIPCGLILNELVTNALKYAFPRRSGGTLRVEFKRADEGRLRLAVADDGVGLPPEFNLRETRTLGLRIVGMLVRQLDGELRVTSDRGTLVEVIFPIERPEA